MTSPYETPDEFDSQPLRELTPNAKVTGFKCPHCTETRPSRARLAAHLYNAHRRSDRDDSGYASALDALAITDVTPGLDAAKQDIMAMGQALTDIAERMQRLDDAATSPDAVRRATLREVHDRLIDAGDYSAAMLVNKMLKEGSS
jgi:predicted RNA-binding Zn-ribbon protein involved in translation (DUF1610 family)